MKCRERGFFELCKVRGRSPPPPPRLLGIVRKGGLFIFPNLPSPPPSTAKEGGKKPAAVTSGLDVPFADYLTSGKSFPCSEPQCPQLKNGCVCWGGYVYVICKVVSGFKEKMGATPPLQFPTFPPLRNSSK